MTLTRFAFVLVFAVRAVSAQSVVKLNVDASESARRIFHVTLTFPANSAPLTLLYPQWIPGDHRPAGPIADLVGLRITASGSTVPWKRDLVDMYAFHLDAPARNSEIQVAFDYICSPDPNGRTSDACATGQLAMLNWNRVLLYPQGTPTDQLSYQASLKLPSGWRYGTALPVDSASGDRIQFKTSSLTTLIDSPVLLGKYFQTIDLSPDQQPANFLDIAGDSPRSIEISPEQIAHYRNLVKETGALFGARHYRDYHFLLGLSDYISHGGIEHHESSDDREEERFLIDGDRHRLNADLLPHEMTHSWNGKYRRPEGLATSDYSQPMKGDLLWVYEGLTTYLGDVLTPRSGLVTAEDYRDWLASSAARLDHQTGRQWRPIEDTAVAVQILDAARSDYADYRRGEEYYPESALIWLEADVLIRRLSKGNQSLDDFCKAFFGPPSGPLSAVPQVKSYLFEDVAATLNAVQSYDWTAFLRDRIYAATAHAPLDGISGSGWKLIYNDVRPEYWKVLEDKRKVINFRYSLGFQVREDDGEIIDVILGSPSEKAGIPPATKLIAVNGDQFAPARLRDAVKAAQNSSNPIELLVRQGDRYQTYLVDYHGGEQFPHLIRDESQPDLLTEIIRSHAR